MADEKLQADSVEQTSDQPRQTEEGSEIRSPSKLIRIAAMTRAMLDEVRQAPLDTGGRSRLVAVHHKSLEELRGLLSTDLLEEFDEMFVPLDKEEPTESELRIAQAQLIGWLEGLFHGIQASLWSQQMAAQAQLQQMQQRHQLGRPDQSPEDRSGLYL